MASPPVQLSDDIIQCNILPRLPFRALVRLAVVCRSWRDLILHDITFATLQAQAPSPASVSVARFRHDRMQLLTPGSAATAAPPDPFLSFLPFRNLHLCACTKGVLCLSARQPSGYNFIVVNPATRKFGSVPYDGVGDVKAGLAYDPATAARDGFHVVVAAREDSDRCRFWRFSSRDSTATWRASRDTVPLASEEALQDRPAYAGGRVYWLVSRGGIVWYDIAEDRSATLPLPAKRFPREMELGNHDIGVWRGRLRVARASLTGVGVWSLTGGGAEPARWEVLHRRRWEEIPGAFWAIWRTSRPLPVWSVGKVGMEAGGEEALCVAVGYVHVHTRTKPGQWRRLLMRYDVRTGVVASVMELVEEEQVQLFDYHSSMAKLPTLSGAEAPDHDSKHHS